MVDELLAEPLDVQCSAAREVTEIVLQLRGAVEIGAARDDFVLQTDRRRFADRAARGQLEAPRLRGSFVLHDHHDLRNHVAGALNDDGIAHPHILAIDLVLVVERCARDRDTTDVNRCEACHGRQGARASDLDFDSLDDRRLLLRRKLERDRPTRSARERSEFPLQVEAVYLDDGPIDLDRLIVAAGEQVLVEADYRMGILADPNVRTDLEAPGLQGFDDFELGLRAVGRPSSIA